MADHKAVDAHDGRMLQLAWPAMPYVGKIIVMIIAQINLLTVSRNGPLA